MACCHTMTINMRFVYLMTVMAIAISAHSQVKYDYNWIIGFGNEGTLINFANDSVTVTSVAKNMLMHVKSGTMSDENGNLLFYTNGCYVANKEHGQMVNGNGLNPGSIHNEFCSGGYPMSQGILIFPSLVNE